METFVLRESQRNSAPLFIDKNQEIIVQSSETGKHSAIIWIKFNEKIIPARRKFVSLSKLFSTHRAPFMTLTLKKSEEGKSWKWQRGTKVFASWKSFLLSLRVLGIIFWQMIRGKKKSKIPIQSFVKHEDSLVIKILLRISSDSSLVQRLAMKIGNVFTSLSAPDELLVLKFYGDWLCIVTVLRIVALSDFARSQRVTELSSVINERQQANCEFWNVSSLQIRVAINSPSFSFDSISLCNVLESLN